MRNPALETQIRNVLQATGRPLTLAEICDRLDKKNPLDVGFSVGCMMERRSIRWETRDTGKGAPVLRFSPATNWGGPKS